MKETEKIFSKEFSSSYPVLYFERYMLNLFKLFPMFAAIMINVSFKNKNCHKFMHWLTTILITMLKRNVICF